MAVILWLLSTLSIFKIASSQYTYPYYTSPYPYSYPYELSSYYSCPTLTPVADVNLPSLPYYYPSLPPIPYLPGQIPTLPPLPLIPASAPPILPPVLPPPPPLITPNPPLPPPVPSSLPPVPYSPPAQPCPPKPPATATAYFTSPRKPIKVTSLPLQLENTKAYSASQIPPNPPYSNIPPYVPPPSIPPPCLPKPAYPPSYAPPTIPASLVPPTCIKPPTSQPACQPYYTPPLYTQTPPISHTQTPAPPEYYCPCCPCCKKHPPPANFDLPPPPLPSDILPGIINEIPPLLPRYQPPQTKFEQQREFSIQPPSICPLDTSMNLIDGFLTGCGF